MKKRVLIIDDQDLSHEIDSLKRQFRRKGLNVEFFQFNVGSPVLTEVLTSNKIDIEKVKTVFQRDYGLKKPHLICFDYDLGPEEITGVDILAQIKPLTDRTQFLFYSSKIKDIVFKILKRFQEGGLPFEKARMLLISLIGARVEEFVDKGGNLGDAIGRVLAQDKETLDDIFEEKMSEYPNFKMEYFDGLELSSLAQLLNKSDGKAIKFKHELVEHLVAYLIRLQDEE